jgi:hypothetical protein
MNNPRRAFLAAIPALVATGALAADKSYLPSKVYEFSQLPVHRGKTNTSRPVLDGLTHEDCRIEVHESDLAPGTMPHPPHHHAHEEMFFVRQGTLDRAPWPLSLRMKFTESTTRAATTRSISCWPSTGPAQRRADR